MALQFTQEMSTGTEGNYWKITAVNWHLAGANIKVGLYVDAAARAADKAPLCIKSFDITEDGYFSASDMEDSYLLPYAYARLKEDEFFATATDV